MVSQFHIHRANAGPMVSFEHLGRISKEAFHGYSLRKGGDMTGACRKKGGIASYLQYQQYNVLISSVIECGMYSQVYIRSAVCH